MNQLLKLEFLEHIIPLVSVTTHPHQSSPLYFLWCCLWSVYTSTGYLMIVAMKANGQLDKAVKSYLYYYY